MRPPTVATEPAGRRSKVDALILGAFVVIATAGQLVRQRGALSWDTVWGEDGAL